MSMCLCCMIPWQVQRCRRANVYWHSAWANCASVSSTQFGIIDHIWHNCQAANLYKWTYRYWHCMTSELEGCYDARVITNTWSRRPPPSLEPRLSTPSIFSQLWSYENLQLWRKSLLQCYKTNPAWGNLDSRLVFPRICAWHAAYNVCSLTSQTCFTSTCTFSLVPRRLLDKFSKWGSFVTKKPGRGWGWLGYKVWLWVWVWVWVLKIMRTSDDTYTQPELFSLFRFQEKAFTGTELHYI